MDISFCRRCRFSSTQSHTHLHRFDAINFFLVSLSFIHRINNTHGCRRMLWRQLSIFIGRSCLLYDSFDLFSGWKLSPHHILYCMYIWRIPLIGDSWYVSGDTWRHSITYCTYLSLFTRTLTIFLRRYRTSSLLHSSIGRFPKNSQNIWEWSLYVFFRVAQTYSHTPKSPVQSEKREKERHPDEERKKCIKNT